MNSAQGCNITDSEVKSSVQQNPLYSLCILISAQLLFDYMTCLLIKMACSDSDTSFNLCLYFSNLKAAVMRLFLKR